MSSSAVQQQPSEDDDIMKSLLTLMRFSHLGASDDTNDIALRLLEVNKINLVDTKEVGKMFSAMIRVIIQAFVMYVYCPDDNGITDPINKLTKNSKKIENVMLKVADAIKYNEPENSSHILKLLFAFVFASTSILAKDIVPAHINHSKEPSLDSLKPRTDTTNDNQVNERYEDLILINDLERSQIEWFVKPLNVDEGHLREYTNQMRQHNALNFTISDSEKIKGANYYNIDDFLKELEGLKNNNDKPKYSDFEFLFDVVSNGDGINPSKPDDVPHFMDAVKDIYNQRNDASSIQIKNQHLNMLLHVYGVLLVLSRRRLIQSRPIGDKVKLIADKSLSEIYVRFYHRYGKAFLKNALRKDHGTVSWANYDSLGTMLSVTLFDNYIDAMDTKRANLATEHPEYNKMQQSALEQYLQSNKNVFETNVKYDNLLHLNYNHFKGEFQKIDTMYHHKQSIETIQNDLVYMYKPDNAYFSVSLNRGTDYYNLYSHEITMFMRNARMLIDQHIYHNSLIGSTKFLVVNEFVSNSWKDGQDVTVAQALDALVQNTISPTMTFEKFKTENLNYAQQLAHLIDPKHLMFIVEKFDMSMSIMDFKGNLDKANISVGGAFTGDGVIKKALTYVKIESLSPPITDDTFSYYTTFGNAIEYKTCGDKSSDESSWANCRNANDVKYINNANTASLKVTGMDTIKTKTIMFDKIFNASRDNEIINISNNMMMGYSATLQQGITILAYGGSGVGKTSLFFGVEKKTNDGQTIKKETVRQGLLEKLFDTIPMSYPYLDQKEFQIELTVYEVYNNNALSQNQYYVLSPTNEADPFTFDFALKPGQMEVKPISNYNDLKPILKSGSLYANLSESINSLMNRLREINDILNDLREKSSPPRIKPTINNPQSSRSVVIYKFEFKYRGTPNVNSEILKQITDNDETLVDATEKEIVIPVCLIDLPGYERLTEDDTPFINKTIENSLAFLKDRTNVDFLRDMIIYPQDEVDSKAKNMRLISFLVINRKGGNIKKLDALRNAKMETYLKETSNTTSGLNMAGRNFLLLKKQATYDSDSFKKSKLTFFRDNTWPAFLALKAAFARSYFELQKDQRGFLDMLHESM